ncbi:hypothetical protein LCGC14_0935100 [marine sediment metagenome]|uniref:N-acetyltransferase domain-containing protein n=1 Tax=marine sediment metagenome TaxID=412755 RepID=A0A0F9R5B2_9ZZZZ
MIRRAKITEIPDILSITKACAESMIEKGIFQWNEHYPSREAFEKDIQRDELYVLENGNAIMGTIVISTYMDEEYSQIDWLTADSKNTYIHRLSVHPDFQGRGFAKQMMDFAEAHAQQMGCASVRLDTFSQNKRNQKFYESRGYLDQLLNSAYLAALEKCN